jgi:DtxR family Mn-dependent transcriptional regulator
MPARPPASTPAPQDYLKAIHRITEAAGPEARANTKAIAVELNISQPSVSAMLDRLSDAKLVDYVHYGGAQLTDEGRAAAMRVIRRHRLLELYLTRFLGFGWDEVHQEAEDLEHVLSDRLEAAIDAALDHPAFDPHGDPIPRRDGSVEARAHRSLWSARDGEEVVVARVSDSDPDLLRHLRTLGVVPGAAPAHPQADRSSYVAVTGRDIGGTIRLRVGGRRRTIGRDAAEQVFLAPPGGVAPMPEPSLGGSRRSR